PVQFAPVIRKLPVDTFIEVSPHPVLTTAIEDTLDHAVTVGTLRRDDGGLRRFHTSLGEAWTHGVAVDWAAVLAGRMVDLPTYAFQHQHYWVQAATREAATDAVETGFWDAVESEDLPALSGLLGVDTDDAAL